LRNMVRGKTRIIAIIIVATIAIMLTMYLFTRPPTQNVSLGVEFNAHATPFFVLFDEKSFEGSNINVTKILLFRTGMELAAGVARGDVVAGQACLGPIIMMVDKGIPVKIIGKVHDGGFALVVNPNVVKGLMDLNGQVIYTPGPGTQAYFLALKIQEKYNISFSEVKSLPPQEVLAGLIGGSITAAILPKPYPEVAESRGLKILLEGVEVWPDMPGSYVFVTPEYLEKNPYVVKQIAKLVESEVHKLTADPSYAAVSVARWLGVGEDVAIKAIRSIRWDTELDVQQIQEYIDFLYSKGVIRERYNASSLVVRVQGT